MSKSTYYGKNTVQIREEKKTQFLGGLVADTKPRSKRDAEQRAFRPVKGRRKEKHPISGDVTYIEYAPTRVKGGRKNFGPGRAVPYTARNTCSCMSKEEWKERYGHVLNGTRYK